MSRATIIFSALVILSGCSDKMHTTPGGHEGGDVPDGTSSKQLIVTDQASSSIFIYDFPTQETVWSWTAEDSEIPSGHAGWFGLPDEAKPVYEASCILMTDSRGGTALVRIKDKKALFYANPGGNPHSAEILPDGNIVVASSDGYLTMYEQDETSAYADHHLDRILLTSAHNVVWDKNRDCLWSAGGEIVYRLSCKDNKLQIQEQIPLPAGCGDAHDMVPVYGTNRLVLSTNSRCFYFYPESGTIEEAPSFRQGQIKSVSTGPFGYETICTVPEESWWTTSILNFSSGNTLVRFPEAEIYKARWRLDSPFSY